MVWFTIKLILLLTQKLWLIINMATQFYVEHRHSLISWCTKIFMLKIDQEGLICPEKQIELSERIPHSLPLPLLKDWKFWGKNYSELYLPTLLGSWANLNENWHLNSFDLGLWIRVCNFLEVFNH